MKLPIAIAALLATLVSGHPATSPAFAQPVAQTWPQSTVRLILPLPPGTAADIEHVYDTNVFGPVRVIQAFLPLLQRSPAPVIVNVSSGLGSETLVRDPERSEFTVNSVAYCSSKAALIMITTQYAKGYPNIRINAVDPGYTATDLNHDRGHQTVQEGTDAIVAMASIGPDGPTGAFTDRHGVVPW